MIVTGDRIDVHCFVRGCFEFNKFLTLFPFSFYFSKSFLVRFLARFLAILASTSILVCFLRWYKLYIKISFLRSEIDVTRAFGGHIILIVYMIKVSVLSDIRTSVNTPPTSTTTVSPSQSNNQTSPSSVLLVGNPRSRLPGG